MPVAEWEDALPDGQYYLRLRAVDADGLEGLNRDHPFEVDLRPMPPQPSVPLTGQRSYDGHVSFAWSMPEEAHGFLLQLSPHPQFAENVREVRLGAVTRHTEQLPPGTWHWRMASLNDKGERYLWGNPQSFEVRPLPAAPAPGEVRREGSRVHLAWLAVAGAAQYELAIGKTPALESLLVQRRLDTTRTQIELKPGRYYWRVRGLEADGQAGAWSQASPIVLPPEAPFALQAHIAGPVIELQWQGQASAYRVEMAADAAFTRVVQRVETTAPRVQMAKPKAGEYWLRVIALGDDQVESPPSPALTLEVRQPVPWWLIFFFLAPIGL